MDDNKDPLGILSKEDTSKDPLGILSQDSAKKKYIRFSTESDYWCIRIRRPKFSKIGFRNPFYYK